VTTTPERPRRHRTAYFWLMLWLTILLALGLSMLILGIVTGRPPYPLAAVV